MRPLGKTQKSADKDDVVTRLKEAYKALHKQQGDITMRPLGKTQKSIMEALYEKSWWFPGCGWTWGTHSETERVLKSLAKRGLVRYVTRPTVTEVVGYMLTPEGIKHVEDNLRARRRSNV